MRFPSITTLALAALFSLTACSDQSEQTVVGERLPIAFTVDMEQTRATYGQMDKTLLKTSPDGFGVFAYYTDNKTYSATESDCNFMLNQRVHYDNDAWTYSPIKYWPNEFGTEAKSSDTDHLSFFAYAPHIATDQLIPTPPVTPPTEGITAIRFSESGAITDEASFLSPHKGDPILAFTTPADPTKQVDLLWAAPHCDKTRQNIADHIAMKMRHALASITIGTIRVIVDDVTPDRTSFMDSRMRVYVNSIKILGKFRKSGKLNLNNSTAVPLWTDNPQLADATTEAFLFPKEALNPAITKPATGLSTGVTTEAVPPLKPEALQGFFILPVELAADESYVEIDYDVITYKGDHPGEAPDTEHRVKRKPLPAHNYEAGQCYKLNLQIGIPGDSADGEITTTP